MSARRSVAVMRRPRSPWRAIRARMVLAVACAALAMAVAIASHSRAAEAPAFHVRSVSGEMLDLDRLRAHGPVLVDFWATWCKPCLEEIPELQRLHRTYSARGLTVIGISVDGPRNFARVRPFASKLGITYPIALDADGSLSQRFAVRAMPTTVLIDRSGAMVRVTEGYHPGEIGSLEAAVRTLLAARADSAAIDSLQNPGAMAAPAVHADSAAADSAGDR